MSSSTSTPLVAASVVCRSPQTAVAGDLRFQGRTVVITGAGGQLGRAGCVFFAKRGARIAALDQNQQALQETFDALLQEMKHVKSTNSSQSSSSFDFCAFPCNVTDAAAVATVVDAIVERFHRIDLLWNNAGYQGQIRNTLDYDPQDFALVMNVNVTGMFIVLQAVAQQMTRQPKTKQQETDTDTDDNNCCNSTCSHDYYSIVNTASVAGLRGTPGMIAYASSKAAVIALTVTAAKDLAGQGIRVNSISPALIGPGTLWDRQNQLHAQLGPPFFATTPQQVAADKINSVPMKRLGTVHEVLQSVAFLLGPEASYTTGTNLVVDGGLSAGMK
jgi:2-hydroxycyclohexanecarboxyl-CoA dehydrogenase